MKTDRRGRDRLEKPEAESAGSRHAVESIFLVGIILGVNVSSSFISIEVLVSP